MHDMLARAVALAIGVLALAPFAGAADRMRLMEIPLDIPIEEDLDGEYLEGIYQEKLLPELQDSVLYEAPIARIESTFSNERKLKIWFTSIEDGRHAYWIALDQSFPEGKPVASQTLIDDFTKRYGKPDLMVGTIGQEPGSVVALKIDPNLAEPRHGAALKELEQSFRPDPTTLGEFWHMEMRQRARLLGAEFRGAVLSFYQNDGKASAMSLELLDLVAARKVLNLGTQ
jgi:hypothetical protein